MTARLKVVPRHRPRRDVRALPHFAVTFVLKEENAKRVLRRYHYGQDTILFFVAARSAETAIAQAEAKFVSLCGAGKREQFEISRIEFQ